MQYVPKAADFLVIATVLIASSAIICFSNTDKISVPYLISIYFASTIFVVFSFVLALAIKLTVQHRRMSRTSVTDERDLDFSPDNHRAR